MNKQDVDSSNTWLWSTEHNQPVQLIEAQEIGGETFFRTWVPGKNIVALGSSSRFLPLGDAKSLSAEEIIYRAAAGKVTESVNGELLLSPLCSNVIPLPHQIYALTRAFEKEKIRYLFADEVGLGKTIEAGLVIKELKLRKKIRRVLILAPKGLVPQWVEEMREKFGEDFKLLLPDSAEKLSGDGGNIWQLFDQVVVPLDSVKPLRTRKGWTAQQIEQYNRGRFKNLISAKWDLVIIDEAHKVAGTSSQVARYRLGKGLASAAPYLLLLSATPHQGKTDAFVRLMSFLDKEFFREGMEISRDIVSQFVIRTEKKFAIDPQGNNLFKPRNTKLTSVKWEKEHLLQKELYEKVTEYVRTGYNKSQSEKRNYIGFLMILMQRLVSSSTRAIRIALEHRHETLTSSIKDCSRRLPTDDEWWELDPDEQLSIILDCAPVAFKEELTLVNELLTLARQCEASRPDVKAEQLNDLILNLRASENDPDLKILIFTEFVTTQEMLREFLSVRGYSVVSLNGSMSLDDRREVYKQFAGTSQIMISTEAGGEGLNLQFCHVVINYDIPWNPMRLEQRIGRVDRIGQTKDVRVFNFLFSGTIEERVHQILLEKLMVILQDLGFDKIGDVLDSSEAEKTFDDLYLLAILNPNKAEDRLEKFIRNFNEIATEEKQSLSLFDTKSTLDTTSAREISQNLLPYWLEVLVTNYLKSHGGKISRGLYGFDIIWEDGLPTDNVTFNQNSPEHASLHLLSFSDRRIQNIYHHIPRVHPQQTIPHIRVQNLPKEIQGIWSLWRFAIHLESEEKYYSFSYFLNNEGKTLITTAKTIGEQIARGEFSILSDTRVDQKICDLIKAGIKSHGEDYISGIKTKNKINAIDFYPILIVKVEGTND